MLTEKKINRLLKEAREKAKVEVINEIRKLIKLRKRELKQSRNEWTTREKIIIKEELNQLLERI